MPEQELFNRIMIMGISGSGKSTLAKRLSEDLGIQAFYLDQLFMNQGWTPKSFEEQALMHQEILIRDQWIIEGNWSHTLQQRVDQADLIIYLDCPLWFSLLRVTKRMIKNWNQKREDAAEGCFERFSPSFYFYIIKYYYTRRKDNLLWAHGLESPPVLYANTSKKNWEKKIEHLILE